MSDEAAGRRRAGSPSWHSSFSRLFTRSPSKEEGGEGGGRAAAARPRRSSRSSGIMENDTTGMVYQRKESSPLPELLKISVCDSKNFSTEELNGSTQEELKKANSLPSLVHQGKTSSIERKTREGFFQYLGSLFGISSKSSPKATEQSTLRDQQGTEKDSLSSGSHQECGHNRLEPDIFVISSSVTEQGASSEHEGLNLIKNFTSDTQDLPKLQERSAGLPKKAELELGTPAVTYATYRGSARVKQLLKKQAEWEQEKQTENSDHGYKDNWSSVISDTEITAAKPRLFSNKSKPDTSDHENDSKVNVLLTDGEQKKEIQDDLGSNEQKELKNNIALLTEEESIKNQIEDTDFVKNESVPQTPEVNKNLLLGSVLPPKEGSFSCQNIGFVRMSSENKRLIEKGEEMLGETQLHIQSNNAAVVDLQKGMHICASGNTETKANIQNECSSNSKIDTQDYEQTLQASKCSYNNWTEEQFEKSIDQSLSLNSIFCAGQPVSKIVNVDQDLHKNVAELENLQTVSENVPIPLYEPRHTKEESVVQDANCNKANEEKADLPTSAQSTKISFQDIEMFNKCGLKGKGATNAVVLASIQSNPNFHMISETGVNNFITKNDCMPPLEIGQTTVTKDLSSMSEQNHTNTPLFAVGNNKMKSYVLYTPLETNKATTDKSVAPVDDTPLSLKDEDGDCHHLAMRGERDIQTEASENVGVPPLLGHQTKFLEQEKTDFRNSTESTTVATPNPSLPKMIEVSVTANYAGKNTSIDDGMRNHSEAEMPSGLEFTNDITIDLPPESPLENMNLPKDASIMQSEKKHSLRACSYPLPASFISEDNNLLEMVPKPVLNSEALSERPPTLTGSSSVYENIQVISELDICGGQSHPLATKSEHVNQNFYAFPQPGNKSETKVTSASTEIADIRSMIIPCFQEAKDTTGSSSIDTMACNATSIKDISKPCSPSYGTSSNTTSLPINPLYDKDSISPKHKSSGLSSETTDPLLVSFDCDIKAVRPAKKVLGMPFTTKQNRAVHISPSGQLHYLPAVEMDDQASTALFTKSRNQFSEEPVKDVEGMKELPVKYPEFTLLLKKANEIVDVVLHLAIEEVRSKQVASTCRTNDIKDNLLGSSLQESRKMLSESNKIKSLSSLKDLNENCIQKLSDSNKEETLPTVTLDDKALFDITDQVALKAKEIVDDAVNAAKQKLICGQYEKHFSNSASQDKDFNSDTEASKSHTIDARLAALLPEINEEPAAASCFTIDSESANLSTPFCLEIKDNKELTRTGLIPNSDSCQKNKDEWDNPTALEEIDSSKHRKDSRCTANSKDSGTKTHNSAADGTSDHFLDPVNEEIIETGKLWPSCPFKPENVPYFNQNIETHICISSKSKGECGSNENKNLPFKDSKTAEVVGQRSHCETSSEGDSSKMESTCLMVQDDRFTRNSISESSLMGSTVNFDLNTDFNREKEALIKSDITMGYVFNECYQKEENEEKSPKSFVYSLPEEWEGKSSFTILYEGTLQDERYCISTEEPEHSLSFPGQSLTESKFEFAHSYDEDNQLNKTFDNNCSESFMTVEAKRFKVYPFSLSPIYEDDSSQEDLLSTDVSPGQHSEKSRDNQPLSVLSLLQSVSERLKSSEWCHEEEKEDFCEDEKVKDEKEICLSSQWPKNLSSANPQNLQDKGFHSRHLNFFSKEIRSPEDALSFSSICSTQTLQKSDSPVKLFPKRTCYETLQNSTSSSVGKGTRFGSILSSVDLQQEGRVLQTLATFQVCPVDRELLKCNPRPGKMVICGTSGKIHEIYHDVEDTTAWVFSKETLIRVVRGCWILYEKPRFQGQKYVLEEGDTMLCDVLNCHNENDPGNFKIGSVRRVITYCSYPEIELYPQYGTDHMPIYIQSAINNLEELEVKNPTLSVKAGVWLAYSDINYKGEVMVLEENHNPCEISATDVKSLHPLTMGGLKVQIPMNIKMIIYGRPHFQGWHKELSENTDCLPTLFENTDDFQGVGSIRVVGGIWVAYNKEQYKGQQYLLEEGEYEDCQSWGGMNSSILLSFRFLQADFMESEVTLFETDEEDGNVLNVINEEIPDLEQAGFGVMARSVHVKSGVWVAYQQKYFCGQQYILEKGRYTRFFDWGASSETMMSIRPIKLEPLGDHEPKHWLKAFSNTHFQGSCIDITTECTDFASFKPCSFKVIRGCWLLHYEGKTNNGHCVLEEDLYSDLPSCGCPAAIVTSLKPIDYVFAEPLISLFALQNCEGKELNLHEAVSSVLNKDPRFLAQSVWVRSGLWIAYEGSNFLGSQHLLEPNKIPKWTQFSGWNMIGSLRPVKLPAVYFRIKNRSQNKYLTVAGNLRDPRATSLCLSPLNRKNTQIWHYTGGLIKSKVNDACLDVIGGRDVPGAKVALWVKHGKARQKWKLNEDGTLSSYLSDLLVLDIKGGCYYDRNYIVVNQLDTSECTQKWDFEIL